MPLLRFHLIESFRVTSLDTNNVTVLINSVVEKKWRVVFKCNGFPS